MTEQFALGAVIRIPLTIRNLAGADVDPTALTLTVHEPDSTDVIYVFGTDIELVKDSAGDYHVDHPTLLSGVYRYKWLGSGNNSGACTGVFVIEEDGF